MTRTAEIHSQSKASPAAARIERNLFNYPEAQIIGGVVLQFDIGVVHQTCRRLPLRIAILSASVIWILDVRPAPLLIASRTARIRRPGGRGAHRFLSARH